jgi:hypothetical protein
VDDPRVIVHFDRPDRTYDPAAPIVVHYEVHGLATDDPPRAVEHSILWYTEGKGEEDLGVHFFERILDPARLPPRTPGLRFESFLPPSPMSYEGMIVKIRWCVRVRTFLATGRDFVSEHEFVLGGVPPARVPAEAAP